MNPEMRINDSLVADHEQGLYDPMEDAMVQLARENRRLRYVVNQQLETLIKLSDKLCQSFEEDEPQPRRRTL